MNNLPTDTCPWAFACAAMAIAALVGCRAKPKDFDNENDALRRQVIDLEAQVQSLTAERGELQAKVAEMSRERDASIDSGSAAAEVVESLPRCAGIEFSRYSGLADRDGTPGPEAIDVYLRPFDGRRRFVQVAGRLSITATLVPSGSAQEPLGTAVSQPTAPRGSATTQPRTLTRVDLGPRELREAYRSGPLGTHYSVSLPLNPPNQPLDGVVVVYVTLIDAISGLSHEATQVLR